MTATNEELAARIDDMRQVTKDALGEIKDAIGEMRQEMREDFVKKSEYSMYVQATTREVDGLKAETKELRGELDNERKQSFERYRANVKWAIASICIPLAGLCLTTIGLVIKFG